MESARTWAGILSLAVGIFVLITIEELPIGVLGVMAPDLGVSAGVAGLAVTVPGVLAGVVALCTPVLVGRMDRRLVLVLSLASVAISCGISVVAPTFAVLLVARLFAGVSIGLYWAVMPIVALGQVSAAHSARALTLAFSGAGGALVLGVPVAAWIGTHIGWRSAFATVGVAALVVAVLLAVLLRPVRTPVKVTGTMMLAAARHRGVRCVLGLTALVVVGQFLTYSYVSPVLTERAGVELGSLSLMLLVYGIAGLAGNFAVGPLLRRSPPAAVLIVVLGMALSLLGVLLLMRSPAAAMLVMPLWGLSVGAMSVALQAFIGSEAPTVIEEGTALNSAAFNTAIALGALAGGRILDGLGMDVMIAASVLMVGAGAALAAAYLAIPGGGDGGRRLSR